MQYCSLQHWTWLPSPVTSTAGCCFCFGSVFSGVIFLLLSSSILNTYWRGKFYLSVSYLFTFSYCSWGSQGQNTELVCRSPLKWTTFWYLENEMIVKVTQSFLILCDPMAYPVHGIFQARIMEWVGSFSLLQRTFPTQGLNPGLPHCRQILYQLIPKG